MLYSCENNKENDSILQIQQSADCALYRC